MDEGVLGIFRESEYIEERSGKDTLVSDIMDG